MAIPINVPAESTLNLGATPTMLVPTATTPTALTSAGNIGAGVAMQNPKLAPTESGLDAFTGAGLGGLIGLMLDRNNKPAASTPVSGLIRPGTSGSGAGGTGGGGTSSGGGGGGGGSTPSTPGVGGSTSGTSNQSDTMLGGMTGNSNSITTGYLQDDSGNLYKDNGDGTASLFYEAIGNTNYIYQGPQYSTSSGQSIYPGAVMDQQGVQIAPNWNWYVNNASDVVANTGDLTSTIGSALDWNSWYTPTDTGGSPWTPSDTSNTDYWTYIDTNIGPSWKNGGLATPMYANGGEVKGYADGAAVTATPTSFMDTVAASAPSAALSTTATPTATTTSTGTTGGTTGGTTSPLSSITDLLQQHSGISGAVIGALLGQLLSGKSAGNVNTGVDMSKIAQITPRTTNFGIGPTGFAPYTAYGTPTTPTTAYGNLYSNMGVSGYGSNANPLLSRRVATARSPFYTFGSPVDPSKYMAEGGSVDDEPHMADGGIMPVGLSDIDMTGTPVAYSGPPSGYDQMDMVRMYSGMSGRPSPSMASRNFSPSISGSSFRAPLSGTYSMPYQGRAMPIQGSAMPTQGPLMPRQGALMPTQGSLMPTQGSIRYNPAYSSARSMLSRYAEGGDVIDHNTNIPNFEGINPNVPKIGHRNDYREGSYVEGPGDGQSDDIPAMLADGEYVIDAETVAQLGNGSNKAGAKILDKFRENIRAHKRSAPHDKIPPKAKSPLAYLKGTK
jgi:hypothetical protein